MPIIRSWALTRGFALHPGTRNRYEIRYTRTQHRPPSRQVNDHGSPSRFTHTRALLRDRASQFTGDFDEIFRTEGIKILKTPVRAPIANAFAERWTGPRATAQEAAGASRGSHEVVQRHEIGRANMRSSRR